MSLPYSSFGNDSTIRSCQSAGISRAKGLLSPTLFLLPWQVLSYHVGIMFILPFPYLLCFNILNYINIIKAKVCHCVSVCYLITAKQISPTPHIGFSILILLCERRVLFLQLQRTCRRARTRPVTSDCINKGVISIYYTDTKKVRFFADTSFPRLYLLFRQITPYTYYVFINM